MWVYASLNNPQQTITLLKAYEKRSSVQATSMTTTITTTTTITKQIVILKWQYLAAQLSLHVHEHKPTGDDVILFDHSFNKTVAHQLPGFNLSHTGVLCCVIMQVVCTVKCFYKNLPCIWTTETILKTNKLYSLISNRRKTITKWFF